MTASTSGFIYTPSGFLGWALESGWQPKTLPVGVIYTFQAPVARMIAEDSDRFAENEEFTVSNDRMYMTRDDGPPVMVACLNPGGASLAAQLENLKYLGDETRFAAVAGTAGALTPEFRIGETVIVSSALRTDAISDKYLPPAPVVDADATFVEALWEAMGSTTQQVRTWTVPVPYRSTRQDLDEAA